ALLDREGRILAASSRVRALVGGMDYAGLNFENVTPVPRERWRNAFARALAGERVVHQEEEIRLADGRHWMQWEARPWRDEDGIIQGVVTYGRDVTSLVSARKVATGSHDLLRAALDAGQSVIW